MENDVPEEITSQIPNFKQADRCMEFTAETLRKIFKTDKVLISYSVIIEGKGVDTYINKDFPIECVPYMKACLDYASGEK